MKVLFLDIDGVLNSAYGGTSSDGPIMKEGKLRRVRRIIEETGARVVLTSSWRSHWDVQEEKRSAAGKKLHEVLLSHGIEITSKTPTHRNGREEELWTWLALHPETQNFAVLDDAFLEADFLEGRVVRTASFRGLSESDAKRAIEILGKKEAGEK
ncbi:MAG: hypothetical protein IJC84_02210 [Clostridia bacterium]|nr:hypothetical protein [Clostridia bacterium]